MTTLTGIISQSLTLSGNVFAGATLSGQLTQAVTLSGILESVTAAALNRFVDDSSNPLIDDSSAYLWEP